MSNANDELVLVDRHDGVTTLTMNNPAKLNAWTMPMLEALRDAFDEAGRDDAIGAVILTGTDPYYCAGVNLSSVITVDHPAKLHAFIAEQNEQLFEIFLGFPKPIIAAVNGPAIGASVTSSVLCDAVIASEKATFSTPFAKLGVTPEGCSSVLFPAILGPDVAERMLGGEGWQPTGKEAAEIGLADQCLPHDVLLEKTHKMAREWIEEGRQRTFKADMSLEQLRAINARESRQLADAFLGADFLRGQFEFLWSRDKYAPALVFLALRLTRPVWAKLLP